MSSNSDLPKLLREIDLDITGYAFDVESEKIDQVMNRDDIVNCFEHVYNFDANSDGSQIADFLCKNHQFDGDVLLTIKNFEEASEIAKEDIGEQIKSYHESYFYMPDQPESVVLISGIDGTITRYDRTLSGRVKTV